MSNSIFPKMSSPVPIGHVCENITSPEPQFVRFEPTLPKEIVERRHGEAIKFLLLPKMGLLGSQAGNEKNCWL